MTPATAFILILVISFIVSAVSQLSISAGSKKSPGQGRKHGKQWEREKTGEQVIVREAENAYFAASHYATPRYALLSGDELHQWIILRCDHNPYEVAHAWKDCPTCIPLGPPKISVKKTPKSVSEKTQGPFPENGSEKNGPAKSYKNGGPVSGKTPAVISGETLDEIRRADAGKTSEPKWSEILGDELTREALRQHLEKNPDALAAVRPTKKPEYAKTHTFDDLIVENCSAETLHETHTWVPMSGGVAKYRRCPGVQDFVPPTWATAECGAHDPHKKHTWDRPTSDGSMRAYCPGWLGVEPTVPSHSDYCVQQSAHDPHRWVGPVKDSSVPVHRYCPGLLFSLKGRERATRWCRDDTVHLDHVWSEAGRDINCLGTVRASTWTAFDRLAKELGAGGAVRPPQ